MASARRTNVSALVLALAVLGAAGCGGDDEGGSSAAPDGPVTELTITSTDLTFDIEAFEVPAGEPVTLTYENEHEDVPHNVHIDSGGPEEPTTAVERGPVTQELTFTLDEPGEFPYLCDVHPATMRGTVTAVAAG